MDVMIYTSDPENVSPARIATALQSVGYFVLSVSINDGERVWAAEGEN